MKNPTLGPLIADIEGIELSAVDKDVLQHPKLGGLIFFTRNFESRDQLIDLVRQIRECRPRLVLTVDHEGGRVQRFRDGFTRIPAMGHLGEMYADNPTAAMARAEHLGWLLAYELVSIGIDHSYAPVLDLDDNKSDVIADRAFSQDADTAIALAERFIEGMNTAGMAATAKHFPGHGSVKADSHLEMPIDPRSFDEIWHHDIRPFEALKEKYAAVMTAHVAYTDVDDLPVSFSGEWINKILKKKMRFSGLVLSDDLSMKGALALGNYCERTEKALRAGCDAVLLCNQRHEAERVLEYLEANAMGDGEKLARLRSTPPLTSTNADPNQSLQAKHDQLRRQLGL